MYAFLCKSPENNIIKVIRQHFCFWAKSWNPWNIYTIITLKFLGQQSCVNVSPQCLLVLSSGKSDYHVMANVSGPTQKLGGISEASGCMLVEVERIQAGKDCKETIFVYRFHMIPHYILKHSKSMFLLQTSPNITCDLVRYWSMSYHVQAAQSSVFKFGPLHRCGKLDREASQSGCFRKWWVFPPNPPFVHRVFHDFHHPFWGTIIFGNTHLKLEMVSPL